LVHINKGKAEVVRWEDITTLQRITDAKRNDFVISSPVQLVVVRRFGPDIIFNESMSQLQRLRQTIEEQTLPHLRLAALEAYEAGEKVEFCDLALSRGGIHSASKLLPPDRFDRVEVSKGQVKVYALAEKWPVFRLSLSRVPNVHLFLDLSKQLRSERI
jgi:hypothetical protein